MVDTLFYMLLIHCIFGLIFCTNADDITADRLQVAFILANLSLFVSNEEQSIINQYMSSNHPIYAGNTEQSVINQHISSNCPIYAGNIEQSIINQHISSNCPIYAGNTEQSIINQHMSSNCPICAGNIEQSSTNNQVTSSINLAQLHTTNANRQYLPMDGHFTAADADSQINKNNPDVPLNSLTENTEQIRTYNNTYSNTFCNVVANNNPYLIQNTSLADNPVIALPDNLLKNTIKHINHGMQHVKIVGISNNLPKQMYNIILSKFWHVFYGHYENGEIKRNRFYIFYDDLFFMKVNVFRTSNQLIDDIFSFVKSVYGKRYFFADMSLFAESNNIRSCYHTCNDHYKPNDNCHETMIFNHNCTAPTDGLHNFLLILQNESNQSIDFESLNSVESICYLMNNADTFFEILSFNARNLMSLCALRMNFVYKKQLHTFFNSDLEFKLLIFPEITSLFRHYAKISTMKFNCYNVHKISIGYYILCKFETFIQYLRKLLTKEQLQFDKIYTVDVMFCKVYIIELYLTYLYSNCFNINYCHILGYVCLNRLLLLSVLEQDRYSLVTVKLIEFTLYNFVNTSLLSTRKQFLDILMDNLFNMRSMNANILIDIAFTKVVDSNEYFKLVTDNFIINLQIFNNIGINCDGLVRKICIDVELKHSLDIVKNSIIPDWVRTAKDLLIEKISKAIYSSNRELASSHS